MKTKATMTTTRFPIVLPADNDGDEDLVVVDAVLLLLGSRNDGEVLDSKNRCCLLLLFSKDAEEEDDDDMMMMILVAVACLFGCFGCCCCRSATYRSIAQNANVIAAPSECRDAAGKGRKCPPIRCVYMGAAGAKLPSIARLSRHRPSTIVGFSLSSLLPLSLRV